MDKDLFLYFFALVPPEDIQSSVTKIKLDFKNRFNASRALKSPPHITLIPPFRYKEKHENVLIDALEIFSCKESKFHQRLEDFGTFPPKVIFINVDKTKDLEGLYFRFMKYMKKKMNIDSPIRGSNKFTPHMTVAFRDLTKENFFLAKQFYEKENYLKEFEVNGICLLKHNNIHWDIIHKSNFKHE